MNRSSFQSLAVALVPGLLGAVASLAPGMLALEQNAGLDWLFRLRGAEAAPAEVAVVSIDSASASAMDFHPDPDRWPRALHAALIDRLAAAGAALIVFDLSFDEPRDAEQDRALADAMRRAGNVLLLERLSADTVAVEQGRAALQIERRVPPIPMLANAALATAPFPLPVVPVKVSQYWVFDSAHGGVPTLPALALFAYARDAHQTLIEQIEALRPGAAAALRRANNAAQSQSSVLVQTASALHMVFRDDPELATDLSVELAELSRATGDASTSSTDTSLAALINLFGGRDSRYLDYYGPARRIETIPYHAAIAEDWDPAAAGLAGRVVFVGFSERSALDQQDTFYTPFSEPSGANLSGVEIGATAFANLLHGRTVTPLSIPAHLLLVLVWGAAIAALLLVLPARAGFFTVPLVGGIYLAVAYQQFGTTGLWLPLLVPLLVQLPAAALVAVAWRYAEAKASGEHAQRTLRYYLPAWVTDDATRQSDSVGARPRLLHGTCIVTDAEQYTALSERTSPQELHQLLNDYYAVLFREVERYGGFVADVVGDSMVAVWASQSPDPAMRAAACRAGLAILSAVDAFNASHDRGELPTRVGVHAGHVLLGDVGAESHFEFRAVGDIVNTASRIQGLNKRLGTRLLISAEALRGVEHLAERAVGTFLLAGKGTSLELHELLGTDDALAPDRTARAERFAMALARFRARDWAGAEADFRAVLEQFTGDGPSRFYLDRCCELSISDPGSGWDGTVTLTEK